MCCGRDGGCRARRLRCRSILPSLFQSTARTVFCRAASQIWTCSVYGQPESALRSSTALIHARVEPALARSRSVLPLGADDVFQHAVTVEVRHLHAAVATAAAEGHSTGSANTGSVRVPMFS